VKSTEQTSKALYDQLPTRQKIAVVNWRRLGNSWTDSLLNSGALSNRNTSTYPISPSEAARHELSDELHEALLAQQVRYALPDEVSRRCETSHHEAAHATIVMALGKTLRSISINTDNPSSGLCEYERGATPLETATICLAPIVWLEQVYRDFPYYLPWGATGCEKDLQKAHEAVGWEIDKAWKQARAILADNYNAVIAIADRLDRDGEYQP
jgi:hypothetical protein